MPSPRPSPSNSGKIAKPVKPKKPGQSGKKDPKAKLKFAGPVKALVIAPQGGYNRTVWCAVASGIVNVLIGAVNMSAIMYSVYFQDAHVALCTISYHFFCAEAILSLNYANGWSTPMRLRHRKFIHVFLQICGMVLAITGTMFIVLTKGVSGSPHGVTGIVAALLSGFSLLSGPCALFGGRKLKMVHMTLGIPTFIMSSISLCLGCLTTSFQSWALMAIVILIIAFVLFYTMFIVITVFMKCASQA